MVNAKTYNVTVERLERILWFIFDLTFVVLSLFVLRYSRAIASGMKVKAAISTPYLDGGGAGLMNTLASVVWGQYGEKKVERSINGKN